MATPGMDEGLLIPIQFSLEEARAALAQLEAQARAAGVRVGEGVSTGAGKGLAGLKAQMGPARESMMFFTQSLGEFGPQGRTAQIAIAGIGGAIMGGGGLLAALSLAQAGARILAEAFGGTSEESEKLRADLKKTAEEGAAKIAALTEALQRARLEAAGFTSDQVTGRMEMAKATAEYSKNANSVRFLSEEIADLRANPYIGSEGRIAALETERIKLEAAARAALAYRDALGVGQAEKEEQKRAAQKEIAEKRLQAIAVDQEAKRVAAAKAAAELLATFERDDWNAREKLTAAAEKESADRAAEFLKEKAARFAGYNDFLFGQIQERFDRLPAGPNIPKPTDGDIADAQAFLEASRIRKEALDDLRASAVGAYQSMARAAVSAFGPMLTGSRAHTAALRAQGVAMQTTADLSAAAFAAILQNALAALAQESLVKSLFQVAEGIAAFARYDFSAGTQHMLAAGKYALVAGVAGAAAVGIGNTRGMTAAERADVASQTPAAPASGGAREVGGGFTGGATAAVHTQTIIVVPGSPFETAQEQARRAARTLQMMSDLNMLPRS